MLEQVQAAQERALAGARGADDRHHLALADLGGDVLEDAQIAVALREMLDLDHARAASRPPALRIGGPLDVLQRQHEHPGDQEVEHGHQDQREERVEGAAADDVARLRQVLHRDVAHDRGHLDERDELAPVDRQDPLHGLRQHDVEEGADPAEAHRDAGLGLAPVYPLDAGPEDLGGIRREIQREGDDRDHERIDVHRGEDDVEDEHQQDQDAACRAGCRCRPARARSARARFDMRM